MALDADKLAIAGLAHAALQRGKQRRVRLRIPERLARETPPSGKKKRTGPSIRLSFSPIQRPMRSFSSGVVRIKVTCGL